MSGATETSNVSEQLSSEIDAGIDALLEKRETTNDPTVESDEFEDTEDTPEGEGTPSATSTEGEPASSQAENEPSGTPKDSPAMSKELVARAKKAGLSEDEVGMFKDEGFLESIVSRLESTAGRQEVASTKAASETKAPPADDLLSVIPDLDPEVYDENIVAGFKAMKELIRSQQEVIAGMRNADQKDWFEGKLESVQDFTKGDVSKKAAVRDKFEVLKAGYEAAGREVQDDLVFEEASKLVLGDAMEQARLEKKTQAAVKRSRQRIARASGHRAEPSGDPLHEIAAEIDAKFFK